MTNFVRAVLVSSPVVFILSSPALAGVPTVPVPEPGLMGIFAGGVVLALALVHRARRK